MKKLIIYLSADKKVFQTIKPSEKFQGDYAQLAKEIAGDQYYGHEVI